MTTIQRHSAYGAAHQVPRRIVIHAMGEYIKETEKKGAALFAPDYLDSVGLSAHALVSPFGTVYRCREDNEGAYHAKGFNTDSLGVEILCYGEHDYTSFSKTIKTEYIKKVQYDALVALCREWIKLYNITEIHRHSDLSPGRKIDPGRGFNFDKFLNDIRG